MTGDAARAGEARTTDAARAGEVMRAADATRAADAARAAEQLVTITGDGTWKVPTAGSGDPGARPSVGPRASVGPRGPRTSGGAADLADSDADRLLALTRLRGLLGDDLEEQIGTRLFLPAALGTSSADQLLPQSLTLLAGTTGDLASFGWRIGPGSSRTWRSAQEIRQRVLEAARIALLGYEGDLVVTTLGPLTLAAATFLGSGERTLADRGALRDLPHLLAEGIAEHLAAVRSHVPGARPRLLIRDGAALALARGAIPTPSEYRRYPALPVPEIGELWRSLLEDLRAGTDLDAQDVTLAPSSDPVLLRAARTAGASRLALAPSAFAPIGHPASARSARVDSSARSSADDRPGAPGRSARSARADRAGWELLAELREGGAGLELVVDPRDPRHLEAQLEAVARSWRELGFSPRELAGFTWLGHRGERSVGPALPGGCADPSAEPSRTSLLDEGDLQHLLRAAPAWAERIER